MPALLPGRTRKIRPELGDTRYADYLRPFSTSTTIMQPRGSQEEWSIGQEAELPGAQHQANGTYANGNALHLPAAAQHEEAVPNGNALHHSGVRLRVDPLGEAIKVGNTRRRDVSAPAHAEAQAEAEAEDGVPRIISYPRLPDDGTYNNYDQMEGEEHVVSTSQSSITKGVLKAPIYGATSATSRIRPLPQQASHVRSKTVGDVPSSSVSWWRRKGSLFSGDSVDAESSKRSLLSQQPPAIVSETVVYAHDDGSLPPNTPLLGSSKMVANVQSAELRRQISRVTWAGTVSVGGGGGDDEDGVAYDDQSSSAGGALSLVDAEYLEKIRSTFFQDAITFAEGTIPQSIVLAIAIGIICGLVAYLYYLILFFLLDVVWKDLPNAIMRSTWWPEQLYVLYIPLVTISLSIGCGLSIYFLGEPGDLAFTIKCVHEKAYEGTSHILPMFFASLFTILAGASLGPEAPLVGISAATAGFVSRKVFKQRNRNVVRKHTLMGMSGALAAFFGVPLGGSLFALEVTSRFGVEYFEHLIEAIACGEVCVAVFRSLAQLPMGRIWQITPTRLECSGPLSGGGHWIAWGRSCYTICVVPLAADGLLQPLGVD